ncbi:hypothetical protein KC19_2G114200 [Ceratodon purpureus]|uniref:Protein kinase domain-containing protein n=1 Tax=Ceratodon purpureus TaxID=3225 RepID=A0A8T0ISQ5_CERPU|nr:hypothetical protein KC19_2G114200 [Ceratodon purpureus]
MEASSSSQNVTAPTTLGEHAITESASPLSDPANSGSSMERNGSVEESIERSKSHWSEVVKLDRRNFHKLSKYFYDKEKADNRKVFRELQSHPTWGEFFTTFGYHLGTPYPGRPGYVIGSMGELVMGEKPFAEGGQAELFHARVIWWNSEYNERDVKDGIEWVVKVFKKGTCLRQLQVQWPHGYLQFKGEWYSTPNNPQSIRYICQVMNGILLKDGRFAFLMIREEEDLRCHIERRMLEIGQERGPFTKDEGEVIVCRIAKGMQWLHEHNIVHRDLKASNILVCRNGGIFVADFECSIGVIGIGFWRAPEILQAIKDKKVHERVEVFSREADVYAYGMTCYEILTGKLPFENHPLRDYDIVLNGARPDLPEYVEDWMRELVRRCWEDNPSKRPSFRDILDILDTHLPSVGHFIEMEETALVDYKWSTSH